MRFKYLLISAHVKYLHSSSTQNVLRKLVIRDSKMNFFRKLFGGKKKERTRSPPRSIEVDALQKLRTTEQLLREKRKVLERDIKKELAIVKENVICNKQGE